MSQHHRLRVRGGDGRCESLTALTTLQQLSIEAGLEVIPLLGNLSLLTHLRFDLGQWRYRVLPLDLASLTRLHNLVHLEFGQAVPKLTPHTLEAIGAITSLRSLHLSVNQVQQVADLEWYLPTTLTRLVLYCFRPGTSFPRGLPVEGLRELCVTNVRA